MNSWQSTKEARAVGSCSMELGEMGKLSCVTIWDCGENCGFFLTKTSWYSGTQIMNSYISMYISRIGLRNLSTSAQNLEKKQKGLQIKLITLPYPMASAWCTWNGMSKIDRIQEQQFVDYVPLWPLCGVGILVFFEMPHTGPRAHPASYWSGHQTRFPQE